MVSQSLLRDVSQAEMRMLLLLLLLLLQCLELTQTSAASREEQVCSNLASPDGCGNTVLTTRRRM